MERRMRRLRLGAHARARAAALLLLISGLGLAVGSLFVSAGPAGATAACPDPTTGPCLTVVIGSGQFVPVGGWSSGMTVLARVDGNPIDGQTITYTVDPSSTAGGEFQAGTTATATTGVFNPTGEANVAIMPLSPGTLIVDATWVYNDQTLTVQFTLTTACVTTSTTAAPTTVQLDGPIRFHTLSCTPPTTLPPTTLPPTTLPPTTLPPTVPPTSPPNICVTSPSSCNSQQPTTTTAAPTTTTSTSTSTTAAPTTTTVPVQPEVAPGSGTAPSVAPATAAQPAPVPATALATTGSSSLLFGGVGLALVGLGLLALGFGRARATGR
ncbi:MAG TPA: hypothetical protein VMU14_14385 [Acidimicrobiales bacterium]|nr:hypothetical protein [Acidimicrobiales bacterium]